MTFNSLEVHRSALNDQIQLCEPSVSESSIDRKGEGKLMNEWSECIWWWWWWNAMAKVLFNSLRIKRDHGRKKPYTSETQSERGEGDIITAPRNTREPLSYHARAIGKAGRTDSCAKLQLQPPPLHQSHSYTHQYQQQTTSTQPTMNINTTLCP